MKAKFDKIMATFAEDRKGPPSEKIEDFKDKNLHKNMKGIISKKEEDQNDSD